MMAKKSLYPVLALFLLLGASQRIEAGGKGPIVGERVTFADPPYWTMSGAWDGTGERLLLVDVLRSTVREYDSGGNLVREVEKGTFRLPVLIYRADADTLWLEDEDGRLLLVNDDWQVQRVLDLTKEVTSPTGSLISVSGWVPLGDKALLVFGDLRRGTEATGAILRVPLDAPARFEILREISIDSPAHRFFLVGQPYLASVAGVPFYAIMGGVTPEILSPRAGGFRLVRNTSSGRMNIAAPVLPDRVTMQTTALLFDRLAKTPSPAGIYGWHGALFVLSRSPSDDDGGMVWTLMKVDVRTFGVEWQRRIATAATHLVVVSGEKYWAFVEKGPVKGAGNQTVQSILRVPAAVFDER